MSSRVYHGHTNLVGREFQAVELHDVLREVANHTFDSQVTDCPVSLNVFFDTDSERWTAILVSDDDFFDG